MPDDIEKLTPMLVQYRNIKKEYPDALLFFRMGDFYELFFEDAVTASRELQIALTSRGRNGGNAAPMCGVPWHASMNYITQLINKGYNVAICDQIEDPAAAKGLVARAVTRVITPGTVLEEDNLAANSHNYLGAAFCGMHENCAFAWADVSTGHWSGVEFRKQADLWQWVAKMSPRELLLVDGQQLPASASHEGIRLVHQPAVNFELRRATERLLTAQNVRELNALGLDGKPALTRACGALLSYIEQTQVASVSQLLPFRPLDLGRRLIMDELTERNLEIFARLNGRKGKGTLRHVLDATITPMGARFLEDMLHHPWRDLKPIQRVQNCVRFLHANEDLRAALRQGLQNVLDLERIIMRLAVGRSSVRDFFALRQSVRAIPQIMELLHGSSPEAPSAFLELANSFDELRELGNFLDSALVEEMPATEDSIFRQGFNPLLDEQLDLLVHGEEKLQALLEEERAKTGIQRLKLGYNKIVGYFWEVPRQALGNVPEYFVRRQGLANAERFTSQNLKGLEEELLLAGDRRQKLESEMRENLRSHLSAHKETILHTAWLLAQLDYWQSLAEVGKRENWVFPVLDDSAEIHIREGRHPVVENIIGRVNFVPNDFHMDGQKRLCLLTGPNMAGKSTVLRQVALIAILAQMGSPVPASSARLGVVDRLFSRVGASDNLAQGQSTFMVEMMETARILRQAGKRSLIILDEIGRGTSTFDGMALAWAVVEDLATRGQGQLRTLFATHYHELTALENQINGVFTMNIAVGSYDNKEILFLHRLLPGPSDKSYGVEVARIAGVPYPVVQRARDILKKLERTKSGHAVQRILLPGMEARERAGTGILEELQRLEPDAVEPEKAIKLLQKWHRQLTGQA